MSRTATALLASLGWAALACGALPVLLPALAAYRSAVAAVAILLFAFALAAPRPAFVAALVSATAAGVSALAFGAREPAAAGSILLFGYLAGAALREVYEPHAPPFSSPLVAAWRAFAALSAVSGVATYVGFRTSYLLARGVPPPHTLNGLGADAGQVAPAILTALLPLLAAAGLHRAAGRLVHAGGRVWLDRALLASGGVAGGVAIFQKAGALPLLRSERWAEWHRVQSTFTDPSAAGVAVALLATPLLAGAAAGGWARRLASAAVGAALLVVLADSGSRAGLVGTITAASVFVLWGLTRLAAGAGRGTRRRVATSIGTLAILGACTLAAAVSWPRPGGRSALFSRVEALLRAEPAPFEQTRGRLLLYEGAWAIFREHPVAGLGLASFQIEFPDVAAKTLGHAVKTTDNPPSLYLGTLAESGLAGAALLALLLVGLARGAGRALALGGGHGPLGDAAAAASVIGLLVIFLFGSHLVYPEVAAFVAVLTGRLPLREDGRTARLLVGLVPVVLAGALVCALGGVAARLFETRTADAAFRPAPDAGVWGIESEPDGRPFRWTGAAAAWRIPGPPEGGAATIVLPVRNAREDGRPVALDVWVDDTPRGRVSLPPG
ncbi:MAG: O-antigen ligase family protein, partial [Thermoanaerobaculia bacterium]